MSVSKCPKCKAYHRISDDDLKEIKEALEKWGILEDEDGDMKYDMVPEWLQFWKERGIE